MTVWRPQISEVFEPLWHPSAAQYRYLGVWGGRGSAKSWDRGLDVVARLANNTCRVACVREVQKSLKDSIHQLLVDTIQRESLGAQFEVTERAIKNTLTGSFAIFMGMRDQNAESIKSLEGFDYAFWEEAQNASARSLELLRPTIRKPGSQIGFAWNPRRKSDPVDILMRQGRGMEGERLVIKANWDANPWFPEELERERQIDLVQNAGRYQHIWEGAYEEESDTQFISGAVTGIARRREFYVDASDPMILGVDVARFGDDDSVIQPRRGSDARSFEPEIISGADTMQLVGRILEAADRLHADAIYVDETGLGAGVIDRLNQLSDIAVGVNFGAGSDQRPRGLARGANKRAEIWIKMREALRTDLAIRDDDELEEALTGPLYSFDRNNHIQLEKKDDMRKRGVKSPDRADALALTYAYPAVARALKEYEEAREDESYDPIWGEVG